VCFDQGCRRAPSRGQTANDVPAACPLARELLSRFQRRPSIDQRCRCSMECNAGNWTGDSTLTVPRDVHGPGPDRAIWRTVSNSNSRIKLTTFNNVSTNYVFRSDFHHQPVWIECVACRPSDGWTTTRCSGTDDGATLRENCMISMVKAGQAAANLALQQRSWPGCGIVPR
jgi:hypothetical protein